jgi:DnaJ-class molecular chaperone
MVTAKSTVNCPTCAGFGALVIKRNDGSRCFAECHQCFGEKKIPLETELAA